MSTKFLSSTAKISVSMVLLVWTNIDICAKLLQHGGIPIWWLEVHVKALGKTFHEELSPPFLSLSDFSKNKNPSYKGNENVFVQFAMDIPWCLGKLCNLGKTFSNEFSPIQISSQSLTLSPLPTTNFQIFWNDLYPWEMSFQGFQKFPLVSILASQRLYVSIPTSVW